jgi:eukaryotic-like serine/threonine-protein kinase
MVPDDKRTKIGPTGPVRPVTGHGGHGDQGGHAVPGGAAAAATASAAAIRGTPAPSIAADAAAAHTAPSASTSYLPAQTDPMLGQVLAGRYLIQRKLGEGGMGAVYLATHNLLEKQVALKVLHGEFARKQDLVERFMQEARAASRIRHENVIDISDFGSTPEGLVFFAMELLKGHDLHEEVARARLAGQLLPWERSKRIFLQLCAALSAAHALGIIHRDLKPENIYLVEFLGEPDFVKLLDFGIAKLTEVADGDRKLTKTGMLFGTPEYMSPEQARGEAVDHRVDIYAMGCILFQLVTGRVPFEADNFMGVLSLHLIEPPPVIPADVFDSIGAPRALAGVIDRALAKDRNQRFATIDDLARAVRQASGDKPTMPVLAQPSVPAPASTATMGRVKTQWTGNLSIPEGDAVAPPRRSKLPLILGAVVLVGGAAVAAAFLTTRGGDAPGGPVAIGSAATGAPPTGTATPGVPGTAAATPPVAPPPAADPTPAAPPPLNFEWAQIRLDSVPPGAEVKELASGKVIGRTPFAFKVKPSRTARQFALHRKDHVDAVVELVPDRPSIEYTEKLERGAAGSPPVVRTVRDPALKQPPPGPANPPPGGSTAPDPTPAAPPAGSTGSTPAPDPAAAGSAAVKPPGPPGPPGPPVPPPAARPDDDCGDPPCLKADPSRSGSGS